MSIFERYAVIVFAAILLVSTGSAAVDAQDGCLAHDCSDAGGNGDDWGDDGSGYLEFLRSQYGVGIDDGGMCFDAMCNMPREECRQYCDDIHDDLMYGCSRLPNPRAIAICRGEAMEEYGRCLRRCP